MDRNVRLRHLLEQLGADLEQIAPLLRQHYESLVQEGIPEPVATELVKDTQRMLLGQSADLAALLDVEDGEG